MRILGIRTSSQEIRYAIVEWNGTKATLLNTSSESWLTFPASAHTNAAKLYFLDQELERILSAKPPFDRIALKVNEFVMRRAESSASRESAYYDAAVLLAAGRWGIPVDTFFHNQIGTNSREVKAYAEAKVGRTTMYWNEQMADAVAVAFKVTQS